MVCISRIGWQDERRRHPFPGGSASPLDPSCGARNIPALTCKPKPASGKHAEQPPDNNKLHNRKMHPRRQAGAAAQPTTMPFCNNGQSSSGPSTPPTAIWTMSRMRRRRL